MEANHVYIAHLYPRKFDKTHTVFGKLPFKYKVTQGR